MHTISDSTHEDHPVTDDDTRKPFRVKAQQFRMGFLLHDVSRMRRTLFDQAMKPLGVTRAQWWLLANLSRQGEGGMTQTDLARVMDLGKVTIGGLIDRLEASGHVERRAHPTDRRVRLVYVTGLGFQVLDEMQAVGRTLNGEIFQGLDPHEIHAAEDVLHRMKDNLRASLSGVVIADDDD